MKADKIKSEVRKKYGGIAKSGGSCGCSDRDTGMLKENWGYTEKIGYKKEEVSSVPQGAVSLGCGNPLALASIKKGQVVLDLGSGTGFDVFLAAKAVGENGKVIGIDMTPEMIKKAEENARKGNYKNVEFRLGEIENLPVDDSSVDVVISNCVINLSPDKGKVFSESYRVLKKGGKLMVSDLVLENPLPKEVREDVAAYVGCVAGASLKKDYLDLIKKVGFRTVEVVASSDLPLDEEDIKVIKQNAIGKMVLKKLGGDLKKLINIRDSVKSIKVLAVK
ncbi:MAG: arsenite methyltransferase [archaeon]